MVECSLNDLPIQSYPYTWARSRGSVNEVEERLDRVMVSPPWMDLFPQCQLHNLSAKFFELVPYATRGYKTFKFENSLLLEPELEDVVNDNWNKEASSDSLDKLRSCTEELDVWGRKIRLRYKADITKCKKKNRRVAW